MLKIKKVSDVVGKSVYSDAGDVLGEIEEVNIVDNKIDGWRIKLFGSTASMIGGARGIIIPHQFVKAIGDVFLVSKSSLPMRSGEDIEVESVEA